MISIGSYNETFPRYPRMIRDAGWIHGTWYCGTAWRRVRLHGQYPPGFLERALSLFPDAKNILHCPSGTVEGPGMTVDLVKDEVRRPKVQASADRFPFPDDSFDLYLSDPPYTERDSRRYGCPPFPIGRAMDEAHRVLRPGGYLGMLHLSYPMHRRKDWDLRGIVAVVTGFRRATRVFSIFRSRKREASVAFECRLCREAKTGRPRWWSFGREETVCPRCFGLLDGAVRNPGGGARLAKVMRRWRMGLVRSGT